MSPELVNYSSIIQATGINIHTLLECLFCSNEFLRAVTGVVLIIMKL